MKPSTHAAGSTAKAAYFPRKKATKADVAYFSVFFP
jgi:hypothetical protein